MMMRSVSNIQALSIINECSTITYRVTLINLHWVKSHLREIIGYVYIAHVFLLHEIHHAVTINFIVNSLIFHMLMNYYNFFYCVSELMNGTMQSGPAQSITTLSFTGRM